MSFIKMYTIQSQKAVSADFTSKQILSFGLQSSTGINGAITDYSGLPHRTTQIQVDPLVMKKAPGQLLFFKMMVQLQKSIKLQDN